MSFMANQRWQDLLQAKVVRIAAPLMVEKASNVRHSSVGALNNLSMVSMDVAEEMVAQVM